MQTLPAVSYPFERVGLDVLGPLPVSHDGNKFIVIFTDYLTKNVEAFPTTDQKTETIAKLLVNEVIDRHGIFHCLLTVCGSNFTSDLFRKLQNARNKKAFYNGISSTV